MPYLVSMRTSAARIAALALALAVTLTGCKSGSPCDDQPNPAKRDVCASATR